MKKKSRDRHLDIPSEANRDKHINFTALENEETDPADLPATGQLSGEKKLSEKKKRESKSRRKKEWVYPAGETCGQHFNKVNIHINLFSV